MVKKFSLKVNDSKTEVCIFHKKSKTVVNIELNGCVIKSKDSIKILEMTFDANQNWENQITNSTKKCKQITLCFESNQIVFHPQ